MTKTQFNRLYRELLKEMRADLLREGDKLFGSCAIDVKQYGDDFSLPKVILVAALNNRLPAYAPLSKKLKEAVADLTPFYQNNP
jgi:hypothetical protein